MKCNTASPQQPNQHKTLRLTSLDCSLPNSARLSFHVSLPSDVDEDDHAAMRIRDGTTRAVQVTEEAPEKDGEGVDQRFVEFLVNTF